MFDDLQKDVALLLEGNVDGHGADHVLRVYQNAMSLAAREGADSYLVGLAALLHDVDDYKLFGREAAENLTNANRLMKKHSVSEPVAKKVCSIIRNMGYNKLLQGVRPHSLEGKVVSDADMLDAMGAHGIIRCLAFALERCTKYGTPIFDKDIFPVPDMSAEEYRKANRPSDNFINHFFEKLLRLKDLMMTSAGRQEAEKRHALMLGFLRQFFEEENLSNWLVYLEEYQQK